MRIAAIALCVVACSSGSPGSNLVITASAPTVAPGGRAFFTARGSEHHITAASWSTNNPSVLAIEGRPNGTATLTGVAPGTATIGVIAKEGGGQVSFEVVERVVAALEVTAAASVEVGRAVSVTAIATFDDGTTGDVTSRAVWSSSAGDVATVSGGLVTGVGIGSARIAARFGAFSAAAMVAVVPGLQAIDVMGSSTVAGGREIRLTAIARFADGSSQDVGGKATWTVDDPVHATVRADGLVVGLAAATVHVAARIAGVTGTAAVEVTPPVGVAIEILPRVSYLVVGQSIQLTAVVRLSDGTTQELPSTPTWSDTFNPFNAFTVSSSGRVTAIQSGGGQVAAELPGLQGALASVIIDQSPPTSVEITPPLPRLPVSGGEQLRAVVRFAGYPQTPVDMTLAVTWETSDPAVVRVVLPGFVRATGAAGTHAIISATFEGVTGQVEAEVQP